jgi:hypothetical protein
MIDLLKEFNKLIYIFHFDFNKIVLKYNWTLPKNSINEEKLLLESQFLLRPVDLKLVFSERNQKV